LLLFCLAIGVLLGMFLPITWRGVNELVRTRTGATGFNPSKASELPADEFILQAYSARETSARFFIFRFGSPASATEDGNRLLWRFECRDGDVTLHLDARAYAKEEILIIDAVAGR
jgi:hypothetical protein